MLTHLPKHPTKVHPRTGQPLVAIAMHPRSGLPVWPIMGGDGTEDDANDPPAGGTENDPPTGGAENDPPAGDTDNEAAAAQLADAQAAQAAAEERAAASDRLVDTLRAALDPNASDTDGPADPAEMAAQVTELSSENAQLRASLLVHELAPEGGGNPVALLDSRSFANKLAALDPESDDYRDAVVSLVRSSVSSNSALATNTGTGRGGAALDRENGRENRRQRPSSLSGAIGAAYRK